MVFRYIVLPSASTAEAPFWFLFLEVANFANAARIIKRVPPPEDPQDS